MTNKLIHSFFALFCALATALHAQNADAHSFKSDTPGFQTVDKHASNLIFVDLHAAWGSYTAYRIAPAVYEPAGSTKLLKPGEIRRLTSIVDRSLEMKFKNPVEAEGKTLEVRPIITSFKRTNTLLNIISFVVIQAPVSFGGVSVRYELIDGESGKQIGAVSCKRNARPWNVYPWNFLENFEALGQGLVILKSDSGKLRKDLERLDKLAIKPAQNPLRGAE
jgi:hypothetical protein